MDKLSNLIRVALLSLFLGATGVGLAGCDDGPMENAGEEMDDAGDDVQDELDDMGDDIN